MVKTDAALPSTTRDHILDVAAAIFAEHGFAGARVDQIALRAGVNKATLYYHVGNKQQLYTAVVKRVFAIAFERLGTVLSEHHDPVSRVRAMTREIALLAHSHPQLPAIVLREFASGGGNLSDELLGDMAELLGKIGAMYRDGVTRRIFRPVDPVMTHMMTVSSLMMLVGSRPLRERLARLRGATAYREPDIPQLAANFADVLLEGIRVRKGKRS